MRSLLLATAALTATLSSAFAPSIADACGGYLERGPRVFAVDTHLAATEDTGPWHQRAFVLLGTMTAPADATWSQLAPGTFDSTRIADLPDPTQSTTFTLVGPSGSRVVSTSRRSLLAQTFRNQKEQIALEITVDEQSQFQIAVLGTQPDAKWISVKETKPRKSTLAWVKAQGLDATYVYTSLVEGTYVEIVSAYQPGQTALTSIVRMGTATLGAYTGTAIGALDLGGKRYVLFENNALITPVAV